MSFLMSSATLCQNMANTFYRTILIIQRSRKSPRQRRCANNPDAQLRLAKHYTISASRVITDSISQQRANILKEVQIMRNLDHPNVVKLIDFSESRQYYYIVLELCPGGELFHQIVRLTYFSEDLSRHVIRQVAEAIEYLHETSGVVHRFVFTNPQY